MLIFFFFNTETDPVGHHGDGRQDDGAAGPRKAGPPPFPQHPLAFYTCVRAPSRGTNQMKTTKYQNRYC
jgi:hypothetical protein